MPFGLNIAPRIFTKVVAHVVQVMVNEGLCCLPYHDDLLIVAPSREECSRHAERAVSILEALGWIINTKKSRLLPAQKFEWLGVEFDLTSHTARAPQEKVDLLQQKLKKVITSESCTRREVMQLQGVANWVGQCDPVVKILISRTRRIIRTLKRYPLDYPVHLNKGVIVGLCKWVSTVSIQQSLGEPSPDVIVQTDASSRGWGIHIGGTPYAGKFDRSMREYEIHILELLAIWYALIIIPERDLVIRVLCDNTTAVSAVKKGTPTDHHLSSLTELIWRRAVKMQWTLSISYIKGSYLADQLSRDHTVPTEWSLPRKSFEKILKLNPKLQVDLFATRLNNQLRTFVSPCPDRRAVAVDALSIPWNKWDHLYLYPPTSLISKAFSKLSKSTFKTAILVTPEMQTRPWFMTLQLLKVPSIILTTNLQQEVLGELVTMDQSMKLRAWLLSKQDFERNSQNWMTRK